MQFFFVSILSGSISSSKANPFLLQMDENETVRMTKDEIMADKYLQMGNDYSVRRHAEEAYKDRILPDVMPPRGANRMTCLFCEKDPTADQVLIAFGFQMGQKVFTFKFSFCGSLLGEAVNLHQCSAANCVHQRAW